MPPEPGFELVRARIHHARRGGARNAFTYGADFVLAPMSAKASPCPGLFARNGAALAQLRDRDHGDGGADAAAWARRLAGPLPAGETWLLTQPRMLGFVFNPVSFWFFTDAQSRLVCVLAEVNNTFGQRCVYICRRDDGGPIGAQDRLHARKAMPVSPYQRETGDYEFQFDWRAEAVAVRILFRDEAGGGLFASLDGARAPMRWRALAASLLRFPAGSLRVLALIYWQALLLRLKGERYRSPRRAAHAEGTL